MKYIGYFTVIVMTMFGSACWSGYALSLLWDWFIVPALGAPSLTIPYAIGLALVVSYLTQPISKNDKDESFSELLWKGCVIAITPPAVALGCGWIVTLFL